MDLESNKIAVVGGGLVGCVQALFMAKMGKQVSIYERHPDPTFAGSEKGRSINLALSTRGLNALQAIDLANDAKAISVPMYGRYIHTETGTDFQPYGKADQCIYSISRANLNKVLIARCKESKNITFNFHEKCLGVNLSNNELSFENKASGEKHKHQFSKIYGADGAYSIIRQELMKTERFNFSQSYLPHGYKELTIPAINGKHAIAQDGLHIWPRGTFMLIALPNADGSFTCTLFMPFEGKTSFEKLETSKEVREFFNAEFSSASELMPGLEEEYFLNPTSFLVSVKCSPWGYKDKVLLLGDASHATVPFYGQGMNSGLEDCFLLHKHIVEKGENEVSFKTFAESRKIDTDAILQLSLNNYVEMRDSTANPKFLLRKKIERRMAEKHPEIWSPLYTLVTFSNIPYHKALRRGEIQSKIMDDVMMKKDIDYLWDSEEVENEIIDRMLLSV